MQVRLFSSIFFPAPSFLSDVMDDIDGAFISNF